MFIQTEIVTGFCMRFLMKTMVNVTRQSNLPVLYGSETPGIWLINWNITMHMNKSASWRRTHFWGLTAKLFSDGASQRLAPHEEQVYSIE